jgi:two-component system, response regulator PdtaR
MTILVLEDEAIIAMDLASAFEASGHTVACFASTSDAHAWMDGQKPTAAVLDFQLQDGNCRCLLHRLKLMGVPVVIQSGFAVEDFEVVGQNEIAEMPLILKPYDSRDLVQLVEKLLSVHSINLG